MKSVKLFREDDKAGRGSPGSAGSQRRGTLHDYEKKELYEFMPTAMLANLRAQKKTIEWGGPRTPLYSNDEDLNRRIRRGLSDHDSKDGVGFNDEFDV